jgi:hypothetical protein
MDARRALGQPLTEAERGAAREQVDRVKRALGERGPVWWTDGSPDFNRKLAKNTPYHAWFSQLPPQLGPAEQVGSGTQPGSGEG